MPATFCVKVHGWEIWYAQRDAWANQNKDTEGYCSTYIYTDKSARFKDGVLHFEGRGLNILWRDLHWNWINFSHKLLDLKEKTGHLHLKEGTVFLTGGIVEHLWQEGYQFKEYLPERYTPTRWDKKQGDLVVHSMKGHGEKVMEQVRTWHVAHLAREAMGDIDEVDRWLRKRQYPWHSPEFAKELGKLCENIIDNLTIANPTGDTEVHDVYSKIALNWVPLLSGVET